MSVHVIAMRARLVLSEAAQNGGAAGAAAAAADPERTRPGNDLPYESRHTSFDSRIILVTAAFLFLLLLVLALHFLIRWLLHRFNISTSRRPPPPPSSDQRTAAASKPMKKRHVRALPISAFSRCSDKSSDVAAQCPICLADFKEGELMRVLPSCQHGFHVGCVDKWLYKQATCPTCRADLRSKGEERCRRPSEDDAQVHVLITPTLCGEPKDHHSP